MPDNLPLEWAIALIIFTAILPVLKDTALWLFNRATHRVSTHAQANSDNAEAEKNRAEAMSTMLDNVDRLSEMVSKSEEKRLEDRQIYNNEIAKRDQKILEMSGQIHDLTSRLSTLETVQEKYEAEKLAHEQTKVDLQTEYELRVKAQEEFAVAKDKWRLEKRNLEDQIEELRMQMKALEAKLSRLEKVHNSTVEIEAVKDDSNGNTDAG